MLGWQHRTSGNTASCQQHAGQVRQASPLTIQGCWIAVTSWWTVGGQDDKERGNNADAINLRQYRLVLPRLPRSVEQTREGNEEKERDEDTGKGEWNEGIVACTGIEIGRRELVKFEAVWVFRDAGHKSLWTRLWRIVSKNVRKCVSSWRADEICEIAKSGCNGSNGRDISEKSVEKWFIRLCI